MKEEALALIASVDDPAAKLNLLREYVQSYILRSLHELEVFSSVAFVGGTALRFLENLPRFSEDLDFSVFDAGRYEPVLWMKKLKTDLTLAGYGCALRWNDRKTVNVAWLRFDELLQRAGIAARAEQKLSIKLEIDTRPPDGAGLVRTVLRRHLTFVVCHYDLESLMAGKVHALITRPYPKGRDWFDLVWYCAHRPPIEPNLDLLHNALVQTQGPGRYEARQWRRVLRERLAELSIDELERDVRPFLERSADRLLISTQSLEAVLQEP